MSEQMMTLNEYVGVLPRDHIAAKELAQLRAAPTELQTLFKMKQDDWIEACQEIDASEAREQKLVDALEAIYEHDDGQTAEEMSEFAGRILAEHKAMKKESV